MASANAAVSGGSSLTQMGVNFGAVDPSPTASLTTADVCGTASWTTTTLVSLLCAPQAYGGSAVATTLTIGAVAGTLTGRFSFDGAMRRAALRRLALAK